MHRSDNLLLLNRFDAINKMQVDYIITRFSQALKCHSVLKRSFLAKSSPPPDDNFTAVPLLHCLSCDQAKPFNPLTPQLLLIRDFIAFL